MNKQRNLIRCIIIGFTVLSAVCMLGGVWTTMAWASALNPSGEPGVAPSSPPTSSQLEKQDLSYIGRSVKKLAKEGYSIDGPSEVVEVGQASITVFLGRKKNTVIDLSGKKILVKDYQDQTISFSEIPPKAKIYVCRKKDTAIVFVLEKKEKSNVQ
ncbi:MAG: hypothetical protein HY912_23910 [Desulfomonile tiedjei]|uniref:Uncharacterized protein n=1 Tax=Desulfomonile tiedjei TaxID=2358 RepID=A0A9D6Z6I2_9BACT|nr:hypothetical protein [Desulfomonile tiedjei]